MNFFPAWRSWLRDSDILAYTNFTPSELSQKWFKVQISTCGPNLEMMQIRAQCSLFFIFACIVSIWLGKNPVSFYESVCVLIPTQSFWSCLTQTSPCRKKIHHWNRVHFGIILVEADEHNELKNLVMREYLENRGYTFLEWHGNYWFVSQYFDEIYQDLVY